MAGSLHLYSVLNREAVWRYRHGDQSTAQLIAAEAAKLESLDDAHQIVDVLAALVDFNSLHNDFEWPPVEHMLNNDELRLVLTRFAEVTESIADIYRLWEAAAQSITGVVRSIQQTLAVIDTLRGEFLFPLADLARLHLDHVGAGVELRWERLESAQTIVSVSPGLALPSDTHAAHPSPFEQDVVPQLTAARWARLRSLREAPPIGLPPIPIPLPAG